MKKLLIITGDLACGKSTFAEHLSVKYGVPLFCKDNVKEILGDTVGFSDRAENRRLSVASVQIMEHIFARLAERGQDMIAEANFRSEELEAFHKIAENSGFDMLTLRFTGDEAILFRRFRDRIEHGDRHPVHQSAGLKDLETFSAYLHTIRAEILPGRVVDVCADDFSFYSDPVLTETIERFMEGK